MEEPTQDLLYLNGVSANSGDYAADPLPLTKAIELARSETLSPELAYRARRQQEGSFEFLVDREKPEVSGWAVVIAEDEDSVVAAEVRRLYEHRLRQIGRPELVKWLIYPADEEKRYYLAWLRSFGLSPGFSDPAKVPYYLLVVGSPRRIPYDFTQGLSGEHAVGRLDFERPEDYHAYIQSLIDYETGPPPETRREIAWFAPRHEFDDATQMAVKYMARPLAGLPPEFEDGPQPDPIAQPLGWGSRPLLVEDATRANLIDLLAPPPGKGAPAVLFTSSHGLVYNREDPLQRANQGALVCQDWRKRGAIAAENCLTASALPAEARLRGVVAFLFACFGGGTPTRDNYLRIEGQRPDLADEPFSAALPQAMLAHRAGGALCCVSHIDRAWYLAFYRRRLPSQSMPFRFALKSILHGVPIGYAMRLFPSRQLQLSNALSQQRKFALQGMAVSEEEWLETWIERNDAEGYVILGDPVVRLRVDEMK